MTLLSFGLPPVFSELRCQARQPLLELFDGLGGGGEVAGAAMAFHLFGRLRARGRPGRRRCSLSRWAAW